MEHPPRGREGLQPPVAVPRRVLGKRAWRLAVLSGLDNCTTLHRRSKNVFALGSNLAHILGATNAKGDLGDDIEVMLRMFAI